MKLLSNNKKDNQSQVDVVEHINYKNYEYFLAKYSIPVNLPGVGEVSMAYIVDLVTNLMHNHVVNKAPLTKEQIHLLKSYDILEIDALQS